MESLHPLGRLRDALTGHLDGDHFVLLEVDAGTDPTLEEIFIRALLLGDVDLYLLSLVVCVRTGLLLPGTLPHHVTFLSAPTADQWLGTFRDLVTLFLAPATLDGLRTVGSLEEDIRPSQTSLGSPCGLPADSCSRLPAPGTRLPCDPPSCTSGTPRAPDSLWPCDPPVK